MAKSPIANRKATKPAEEDNEEPAPASTKGKGGLSSLAKAFNNSTGLGGFSVGKHEARIINMEVIESDKGTSVMYEYQAIEGDDDEGKKMKQWSKLLNADGTVGPGVDFLKADLIKLGYENVTFDDLEATLKEITQEEPVVELKVVQNGQFLNAYLQGKIE